MYNLLDDVSYKFLDVINSTEGVVELSTEDYGWTNYRFKSDVFRMAHVERYTDTKVDVLHITTFPYHWSPEPIFGFDVIISDNNPIGEYMDLSPGLKTYPFDDGIQWVERKPLPEWATVFSDGFLLIKPESMDELRRFCDWVLSKYKWYIEDILSQREVDNHEKIIEVQNRYCEVQSQNPRTFSVLKKKIGENSAKYFMENILFPKIKVYK